MITDIHKRFLQLELEGKIKRKQNPRKFSAYERRMRERIDHMLKNGLWLAQNRPDILQDVQYELADETLPRYRRAKALLKMVTLFEREDVVLSLLAEIYSEHQLEVTAKKNQ